MSLEVHASERAVCEARCPFCHEQVGKWDTSALCSACAARMHAACFEESGECAACREKLPAPDASVARIAERRRPARVESALSLVLLAALTLPPVVVAAASIASRRASPEPPAVSLPERPSDPRPEARLYQVRIGVVAPETAIEWATRGEHRLGNGDAARAIDDLSRALELDPSLAFALVDRGKAKARRDDGEGAIADFTRAIELRPSLGEAWLGRGRVHAAMFDFDAAISDVERALEADKWNFRSIPQELESFIVARSEQREKCGDLDGAIADRRRVLERNRSYWNLSALAQLLRKKGDLDGAIALLAGAIDANPPGDTTWRRADLERLREDRGALRERKGDIAGAIADFATTGHLLDRARKREAEGDLDSAFAYRDAFARGSRVPDPDLVEVLTWLAWARERRGDVDGALLDLDRAIELSPSSWRGTWARIDRARIRKEKGDVGGAIADMERFVEMEPNHAWARKDLAALRAAR